MGRDNVDCVFHRGRRCSAVEVMTCYPLCPSCARALEPGQITYAPAILRAGVVKAEKPPAWGE